MKTICWFRQDLRTSDNPALTKAARSGEVIPVFILDDTDRQLGGASRWWLHHSLDDLSRSLGGLVLLRGDPVKVLPEFVQKTGATSVFWNRSYEPHCVERDTKIKRMLKENGIDADSCNGSVIAEPWELQTGSGGPYKVYTPFWKSLKARGFPAPLPAVKPSIGDLGGLGCSLQSLDLLPKQPNWAEGWEDLWTPGETGAAVAFDTFLEKGVRGYGELRNRPDLKSVSRLSPHIHFGEISPRQLCAKSGFVADTYPDLAYDIDKFQSEIAWRDFANHLLFHFPKMPTQNWKPAFDSYPWQDNVEHLAAWQQGKTGYPMVDAGMRELWATGYMHNRVRMITASFLVKHLRIDWRHGEAWFWNTLVDADLANNCASWQWVTGCGADAAPYFRIFNPISQGSKFDPNGVYVRKWCPELANLPDSLIHAPFEADADTLAGAGISLGNTYPLPIVDHKTARQAALDGYQAVKNAQSQ